MYRAAGFSSIILPSFSPFLYHSGWFCYYFSTVSFGGKLLSLIQAAATFAQLCSGGQETRGRGGMGEKRISNIIKLPLCNLLARLAADYNDCFSHMYTQHTAKACHHMLILQPLSHVEILDRTSRMWIRIESLVRRCIHVQLVFLHALSSPIFPLYMVDRKRREERLEFLSDVHSQTKAAVSIHRPA